jgi:hypothetical protein
LKNFLKSPKLTLFVRLTALLGFGRKQLFGFVSKIFAATQTMEIFNEISSKFFDASVSYVNLIEIMAI